MNSFQPEKQTCPVCGSSLACHIHAYYDRPIINFICGVPVTMEVTVLLRLCERFSITKNQFYKWKQL
uniref:hypothetical protein n=1 Tax=Enterocloster aldenensis TaxID=358742 RepID=UPI0011C34856